MECSPYSAEWNRMSRILLWRYMAKNKKRWMLSGSSSCDCRSLELNLKDVNMMQVLQDNKIPALSALIFTGSLVLLRRKVDLHDRTHL